MTNVEPSIHSSELLQALRDRGVENPHVLIGQLDDRQTATAMSAVQWWDAQPHAGRRAVGIGMLIHRIRTGTPPVAVSESLEQRSRRRFDEAADWCEGKFRDDLLPMAAIATCALRKLHGPGNVTVAMVRERCRTQWPDLFTTQKKEPTHAGV